MLTHIITYYDDTVVMGRRKRCGRSGRRASPKTNAGRGIWSAYHRILRFRMDTWWRHIPLHSIQLAIIVSFPPPKRRVHPIESDVFMANVSNASLPRFQPHVDRTAIHEYSGVQCVPRSTTVLQLLACYTCDYWTQTIVPISDQLAIHVFGA